MLIEVCVDGIESALAAVAGGANRLEVCSALSEGGITPSIGTVNVILQEMPAEHSIPVHVLIRPRPGDFCYSKTELEVIKSDIRAFKSIGVAGVVFGVLTSEGAINKPVMEDLVTLSHPMHVTFHRAFDMTSDPLMALQTLTPLVNSILTSGHARTAFEGRDVIKSLVLRGGPEIIAAAGITETNAAELVSYTNVRAIHGSFRKSVQSTMKFQNPNVHMGKNDSMEYVIKQTCEEKTRALRSQFI